MNGCTTFIFLSCSTLSVFLLLYMPWAVKIFLIGRVLKKKNLIIMSCGRCHHLSDSSVHVMLMVSSCSGRNEAPTLTQTLCETLSFLFLKNLFSLKRFVQLLFLQNLLLLKHFVKRSVSSSFKTYSHSNTLCNDHFPLPSKPTLTQTLWETLTFLLLQNLIEV